ncbi:MAG TPA: Gfo/Idh/MocA family oxidoreductase [bacterium]|nr:Gfo/Idh/MocA family oxidoreductase [bacterium]HQL62789.1 Gfo/Idh/MocA family oxidoreductase [bacterium]
MNQNVVKVAVIGAGSLGQHHARVYAEHPDAQLAGIVDVDRARAEEIASKYRTRFCASIDELDSVDAASVVVPTEQHFSVASRLLERGVHCLVEKPMTLSTEDGEALCRLAEEKNLILQVGHIERFNPAVMALNEVLENPLFIEAHRLGPPAPRVKDIGVVMDLMIHDLDLILALVKSEVVTLDAIGVPVLTPKEDIANARLRFASGCIANVTASRITVGRQRKIRIFQPNAYLSLDYLAPSLEVYRKAEDGDGKPRIEYEQVHIESREPLETELSSFLEAVRGEHPPVVNGRDGLRALHLAESITRSINEQFARWPIEAQTPPLPSGQGWGGQ